MTFDKYTQLSEDAQRLLCYYAWIGLGSGKRNSEHFYILKHYCFPLFNGNDALEELLAAGIMIKDDRDWFTGEMRYGINIDDFVPVLWYLLECRKDIFLTLGKCRQLQAATYLFIRHSVRQLVESQYSQCDNASSISIDQAYFFYSIMLDAKFRPLLENLSPNTFVYFFEGATTYLITHDIVADTTYLMSVIKNYHSITETIRCKLIAEFELYNYIASGQVPQDGMYANISAGYILGALRHLNSGNAAEAVKWFIQSLKREGQNNGFHNVYANPLLTFYLMVAYMAVVNEKKKSNAELAAECTKRLVAFLRQVETRVWDDILPAKLLVEDFRNVGKVFHKQKIDEMYKDVEEGKRPVLYRHLAFLLANYLGYSTKGMDVNHCIPNLALLRHEMSKYLPLYDAERETLQHLYGTHPALTSIYHKAEWESVLEDLMNEATGKNKTEGEEQSTRLMYLRFSASSTAIQVREQTRLKNGRWGSGKVVSDARYRRGDMECMNNADRRILARLNHSQHWELRLEDVIEEMVDESRLYTGQSAPYELVKVERDKPYLMVEDDGTHFQIKSNVPISQAKEELIIVEDSPTHYSLITIPSEIRDYYIKLLQLGTLPLEAKDTLRSLLNTIGGKVELHSSLIEGGSTLPLVDGQWNIGFRLSPKNGGNWEVEVFVRPLQGGRRTYPPAEGDNIIIDENKDGRMRVKRNLPLERSNQELVSAFWQSMGYDYQHTDTYPPEFLLELVQTIQENPDTFYAEWPEGQNIRIKRLARGAATWNGVVKAKGQWFDIEGDIDIDEHTRISISQLLELVGKSKGKYIQMGDGEFLALSEKLKNQLQALDAIANRERGKIKISPFSAALMGEDILHGDIELQLDEKLSDIRQRIIDGSNYSPAVPKELNATLRPYQRNGYLWIARLNSWGAGALLADDMGLGKTIQTIAFLLLKKDEGPSLVVAPASVAPNWKTELERFAPTLNVLMLNTSTNRHQTLHEAKAGDVVVTTYGILLSIQDDITQKQWNVACLDEAHIIKNRGAKTSAAAMKIQATNRVMLTGTPVQNHLGELWSLFQFVNPGLLGGYEHFSQKFIIPIEGFHDKEKQEQLEHIVHPFMLRRTKQAVLRELPEKTEIYHSVELSRDELAIYESIRIRAERMLQASGGEADMHVLAEITRLRQAACSAQLIEPKWTGECSKITALAELLQGVIEGGNRALVFSQFVSFFDLVRRELDRLGMKYFYIDGSTPVKKRTEMVEAFQKGENPLFLISLKAGGLGLNLTGANYVFLLDPWWNPAIEQQATDRAHRIGQHQAVTVYHLVSKNTIEEKIIRLHQTKRHLADNILAGTDTSYKLTGEDLLEMVAK